MTLAAWINPDDDAKRTDDGTNISAIDDNARVNDMQQGTAADQPFLETINLRTVMGGNLTRDRGVETLANYTFTGPSFTAIVAYTDNGNTAGTANNGMMGAGDNDGAPGWMLGKPFAGTAIGFTVQSTGQRATVPGGGTANNIDIVCARYDHTRDFMELIKNGGQEVGTDEATANPTLTYQLSCANTPGMNAGWGEFGLVGDCILWEGAMRYDQMQRCEGYLAHKYNAVDALPTGHPFKDKAPDVVLEADFLANFLGQDGDTAYTAETGQVMTAFNARLRDGEAKFGDTSLEVDDVNGVGNKFPASVNEDLSNTAFTVEGWFSFDDTNQTDYPMIGKWDFGANQRSYLLNYNTGAPASLDFVISSNGAGTTTEVVSFDDSGGGWVPTVGQFYHIAASYDGDWLRLFIDGVLVASNQIGAFTPFVGTAPLGIGSFGLASASAADQFDGNIDSVRIFTDKCIYTTDFLPPVREFKLPVEASLIANFNGQDADVAYTSEDAGARVATFVGNAQLDSAQKKFGHTSLLLDGTGDYVSFPDSVDHEFGGGDFSVEQWVRWSTDPGTGLEVFCGKWGVTTPLNQREWLFYITGNLLTFAWSTDGTGGTFAFVQSNVTFNPVADQWYHIKVERTDDLLTFWVDGACFGVVAVTATFFTGTAPLSIGGHDGGQEFTGWIDGVQIVKGRALRSTVEPLSRIYDSTDPGGANLLLNFEGPDAATAYVSDDINDFSLSFFNSAQLDTAERRRGQSSLLVAASNDYVSIPSDSALTLGSGDWTIEMHIRPTIVAGGTRIFYDQRTVLSQPRPTIYIDSSGIPNYYVNGANRITGSALSINTWYHIVVEKVDGVTRMYVNGAQVGSDYADGVTYTQERVVIGEAGDNLGGGAGFQGHIDGVRVSVGTAVYRGDFTAPINGQGEPII